MFFATLWKMSIQAAVLIMVVLVLRLLFCRLPKRYSYFLWLLVLVRLLCPVFPESSFSMQPQAVVDTWGVFQYGQTMKESYEKESTYLISEERTKADERQGEGTASTNPFEKLPKEPLPVFVEGQRTVGAAGDFTGLLSVLWGIGTCIFLLFQLVQYVKVKRRVAFAVRMEGEEYVWQSENIDSPFVMGIIRPRIYLPYGLENKELPHILKHERMHIRHGDIPVRMLAVIALGLHWWNPAVWIAWVGLNRDMEMFCDEAVLENASMEEKKEYSTTLLNFAERHSNPGVMMGFGQSSVKRRVEHVLHLKKPAFGISLAVSFGIVVCTICFLTVPRRDTIDAAEGETEPVAEPFYRKDFNDYSICLTEPLTVYHYMDTEKGGYRIEPQRVCLRQTDDRNWIRIIGQYGSEGYLRILGDELLDNPNVTAQEVFLQDDGINVFGPDGDFEQMRAYRGYLDTAQIKGNVYVQDYYDIDGDGEEDRVYRGSLAEKYPSVSMPKDVYEGIKNQVFYRIEFGNGDILETEKMNALECCSWALADVDGDKINEIICNVYSPATDPYHGLTEIRVYKKQGNRYELNESGKGLK